MKDGAVRSKRTEQRFLLLLLFSPTPDHLLERRLLTGADLTYETTRLNVVSFNSLKTHLLDGWAELWLRNVCVCWMNTTNTVVSSALHQRRRRPLHQADQTQGDGGNGGSAR